MLNIAICDDSREDRKRLRKFLEETGFLVSIQEFESGEALLRLEESFPVIFLDIDMILLHIRNLPKYFLIYLMYLLDNLL